MRRFISAIRTRWDLAQYHETGSDAEFGDSFAAEYTGAQDNGGHPIPAQTVAYPFYIVNPARNNGQDIEPIPITPVRGQNWPEMQIQLNNGWSHTNYGKRISYDDYLRMLTDSSTKSRHNLLPSPSGIGQANKPGPAPGNVQSMIDTTSGAQPNTPGGPGFMAAGLNLTGRHYYG